jgi:hypothetical protein
MFFTGCGKVACHHCYFYEPQCTCYNPRDTLFLNPVNGRDAADSMNYYTARGYTCNNQGHWLPWNLFGYNNNGSSISYTSDPAIKCGIGNDYTTAGGDSCAPL